MSASKNQEREAEEDARTFKHKYPPVASEIAKDIRRMRATDDPPKASSSSSPEGEGESADSPFAGDEVIEDSF